MITDIQKNIIINTLLPYKPTKIGIFGSYARGENTTTSDIDILYDYKEKISLLEHIKIINILKEKLALEIDLVTERALNPLLKTQILNDLEIIYENE